MEKSKNKAEEETPSGVQKNRILNLYAPSGLVVYVSSLNAKKSIRRRMMELYGSGQTSKEWATWPDGSMMRFIPYLSPTSQPRYKEKLKAMMYHQICTKANETSRHLDAIDLFTEKEYLNTMTLQEAILKPPAEKMKGMPVFKHITKKLTRNHLETKYQINSYATLSREANATVPGLLSILQEKYGSKVLKHFTGESILDSYSNSKGRYLDDEDGIVTENTLGDDTVSIEQRRKWKEKKSINKRLIAINASHEDLEQ